MLSFDRLKLPLKQSVYFLIILLTLLVVNQLFLDSTFLLLIAVFFSAIPLYSIYNSHLITAPESTEISEEVLQKCNELNGLFSEYKALMNNLWEKASKVSLGTDAQSYSLEETNKSIEAISETISKTVGMVERLSPSADKASKSILGMVESINEISSHNKEMLNVLERAMNDIRDMSGSVKIINDNFVTLSKASENSSKGVMEIDSFAKEIERSSLDSHKMSEDVARESELGVSAVLKTIESMENIKNIVSESSSVIKTLGDKSGEIGNVVSFINTLTKRINLLALNASIIASQAGEHGTAFAVVASEMEKLATQTSSSTVEISQLIEATQEMVHNTVQANEIGMWGVEEGVTLANKAGDILKKIQASSTASLDMSKNILAAT